MHWFGSLLTGSKAVLLKGVSPKTILETVSNEKCTIVWLLVPWAQDILVELDSGRLKPDDYELSQWRLMHICLLYTSRYSMFPSGPRIGE